jgi:hypothetical protein
MLVRDLVTQCLQFYRVRPCPRDDFEDMLTIAFRDDGKIAFGSGTDSPVRLAARLRDLVAILNAEPSIVEEAAGIHGAVFALTGETPRRLQDGE